ncbi:hypothetical protein [Herbidospora sp. NBRC 101105]|uniref:hypothetical protein n=1 Tax=Herbidospora sp. NBRC 101105 TaxID=3032195 RepID=UPI0024A4E223|nr:hypothetical protein [Herbidospora sp. NBRC 101105]GLX96571.1 hypothetical protein Hesp01_45210 [Herbidospora sp. NBRC 101105]
MKPVRAEVREGSSTMTMAPKSNRHMIVYAPAILHQIAHSPSTFGGFLKPRATHSSAHLTVRWPKTIE